VQTDPDLHTVDGLINLFNLAAFSAGHIIKQVQFPAILLPCAPAQGVGRHATAQAPCYVTADPAAEQRAFNNFMAPTHQAAPTPGGGGGKPRGGGGSPGGAGLMADPADGKSQAAALGNMGMPVYVPRQIATGSSYESGSAGGTTGEYPRAYEIHDQSGNAFPAYRMVLVVNPGLGQYYGVQGTAWKDPPILKNPNQTRNVGGKRLELHFNGRKLTVVGWRNPQGSYWISNTLTNDLTNAQMTAIAASLAKAGP
jgi:hypothetical protein